MIEAFLTSAPSQDFDGEAGDVRAGRDYFKRRFAKLAQKAGRSKEREIYIQYDASFACRLHMLLTSWMIKHHNSHRYSYATSRYGRSRRCVASSSRLFPRNDLFASAE